MKKIILLITITLSTVGCGMAEDLTRACGGSLTQLCDMLFGRDSDKIDELKEEVDRNANDIQNLEERIVLIQNAIDLMIQRIEMNQMQIDTLEAQKLAMEAQITSLQTDTQNNASEINSLEQAVQDLTQRIITLENSPTNATIQVQINDLIADLAALEDKTIVEYIDPCGPSGGYDEIIMVTGDGKHIAYFQSGNGNNQRRHLTILNNGSYQTTDAQQCPFSIVNGQYQE